MIFSGCPKAHSACVFAGVSCPSSVPATAEPAVRGRIMAPKGMTPAKPPLPTDSYRPVQAVCGSQTSNLMSESLVGLMLPPTRQKATGTGFVPAADPGGVNAPAASDCAIVIV